jgi:hypothetical protein
MCFYRINTTVLEYLKSSAKPMLARSRSRRMAANNNRAVDNTSLIIDSNRSHSHFCSGFCCWWSYCEAFDEDEISHHCELASSGHHIDDHPNAQQQSSTSRSSSLSRIEEAEEKYSVSEKSSSSDDKQTPDAVNR